MKYKVLLFMLVIFTSISAYSQNVAKYDGTLLYEYEGGGEKISVTLFSEIVSKMSECDVLVEIPGGQAYQLQRINHGNCMILLMKGVFFAIARIEGNDFILILDTEKGEKTYKIPFMRFIKDVDVFKDENKPF